MDGKKSRREALPGTGSVLRRTSYFLAGHYPHHDGDDHGHDDLDNDHDDHHDDGEDL